MTVWAKNEDVPEKQDKYNIVVLEIDCDKKLADNPKLPRNSYIVTYMTDGVEHHDIIIGLKVNIFDCYYDSLGKGSLQSIEYTRGQITAKLFDAKKYIDASNKGATKKKG